MLVNRSANPTLNKNTFANYTNTGTGHMTIDGTVNKTFIMLVLVMITSFYSWNRFLDAPETVLPLVLGGAIGGLVIAIVLAFKKQWATFLAPAYAVLEGLFLGAISAMFESQYEGIVFQAISLTFGTLLALLLAYKSGMIKVTDNFRLGVVAATGGIFIVYIISFVLSFFGISVPLIHSNGLFGILFSLFVITIAALNLVLDFDFIEHGAETRAPKYMEWYGAFGLMVTLIWLYIEFLRLLAKLRSR